MLYDPKWEKPAEQTTDPLSLSALIAWLETKNPKARYCYDDHGRCLAAQYNKSIGRRYPVSMVTTDEAPSTYNFDNSLEKIALGDGIPSQWTFGSALKRASFIHQHNRWPIN